MYLHVHPSLSRELLRRSKESPLFSCVFFMTIEIVELECGLYCCLYKKAFDKVNHNKLIEILTKYDVPSEELTLISNLYWSQTAQIRGRSEDSQSFKIEKGVRQGCVLSPVFFNLYSEELINEALQDETGLVVNGVVINNI